MDKKRSVGVLNGSLKIFFCAVTFGMLLLGTCFSAQAEEVKTVDWYKLPENKAALEAKLEECRNNPGQLENTPNCKNARAAHSELFMNGGTYQKVKKPNYDF